MKRREDLWEKSIRRCRGELPGGESLSQKEKGWEEGIKPWSFTKPQREPLPSGKNKKRMKGGNAGGTFITENSQTGLKKKTNTRGR